HTRFCTDWSSDVCSSDLQLETNPAQFLPEVAPHLEEPVIVDLNRPMADILAELSKYPIKTRLKLNGTVIVARDIAHAKIKEMLRSEERRVGYDSDIICRR